MSVPAPTTRRRGWTPLGWAGLWLALPWGAWGQYGTGGGEWRSWGGDPGCTHYSPLDQIHPGNVGELRPAWSWTTADAPIMEANPRLRATYFQATPLMIDGRLFVSTCLSQAAAIDPRTGQTLWVHDPKSYEAGRPPNLGFVNRGLAYWAEAGSRRLFLVTGDAHLVALDPVSGRPIEEFGAGGRADLAEGVPGAQRGRGYGHTSAALVCRDVVIVGSSISDGARTKEGVPGVVMGFDVRTGRRLWSFRIIARPGEAGGETWEDGSAEYTGGGNVWTMMSADEELGYVYLPTSTPTSDFYGGHRLGDNLFAESLVCLEAATGRRVWHFQMVHHGLWDYDLPCAPNLVDITVEGRRVKAVAQVSKQGFAYVFDRVTGAPVWPIEERPVPPSTVPGERASPTQPFPTRPPPFERQGVAEDDVIDFTPELRARALEILRRYDIGPLFTPPSLRGTVQLPGHGGGANWPGAAFDPDTGLLYVPSMTSPLVAALGEGDPDRTNLRYTRRTSELEGPEGLPILKPPYARVTAIDLNRGEHVWAVVNGGDGPRDYPLLKELNLPPMGTLARAGALVTRTLLFVTEGSGRSGSARGGGRKLRALDKSTGRTLAEFELPDDATGVPMTYLAGGKQYVAVAVGSSPPQLVALSLP